MGIFLSDLRFLVRRMLSIVRRVTVSVRTQGVVSTARRIWSRVLAQRSQAPKKMSLWLPDSKPFGPFSVPHSDTPRVSIVIPVYGQLQMTIDCLRALQAHPSVMPVEIIVVDDGSPDETAKCLPQVSGLRYCLREENGGFIAACNDGAAMAQGDLIVFLNNDTLPQSGWLEALISTFDMHPKAGLVGAKLVYPDGRLQEAGGVVFADGSAWNYGRFDDPQKPIYGYVREADYVSGAAIAISRKLFLDIGGFDARYAPAYYEDTDLAFAVRAAGYKVLYQPAAVVVHREGATAGNDETSGIKAYQVRNAAVFAEKWHEVLTRQIPKRVEPTPANLHRRQRQVLIIDATTPMDDRDSGSLRMLNLMRLMKEEGLHVCFIAGNAAFVPRYTEALQSLGIEVWYSPYMKGFSDFFRRQGARFDVVMLSRHYIAEQLLPLVHQYAPQAKVVFDTVDLHYLRERRGAEVTENAAMLKQSHETQKKELRIMTSTDVTLVVSPIEREELAQVAPHIRVEIISNLYRIEPIDAAFSSRSDLLFVGSFQHPPNVDAVCWFCEAVFPIIHAKLPQVRFHIVGSEAPPQVQRLSQMEGVVIHGYVPDLKPLLGACRIALAPLRYGAGVKGKVNQAMAHGLPVVATTMAMEGMHLSDGVDVLVADTPHAYAEAVLRLYDDPNLWNQLSKNGLKNVYQHFSFEAGRSAVRKVFLN